MITGFPPALPPAHRYNRHDFIRRTVAGRSCRPVLTGLICLGHEEGKDVNYDGYQYRSSGRDYYPVAGTAYTAGIMYKFCNCSAALHLRPIRLSYIAQVCCASLIEHS